MTTGLEVGTYDLSTDSIIWENHYSYASIIDLVINDGLGAMSDSASWSMRYPTSYVVDQGKELPLGGQLFRIIIDDVKMFEGIIGTPANRWLSGGAAMEVDYTGDSYVRLLDRHLVVGKEIPEQRAGARIRWALNEFAKGFTNFEFIQDGPYIPVSDYDYVAVSSVISNIANQVNYLWSIDYDKKIHFFHTMEEEAPISIIDADAWGNVLNTVGDLEVIHDATGIANVIILKDFASKDTESHSHETKADGTTSFFSLPLPPFSVQDTDVYVRPEGTDSWVQRTVVPDPLGIEGEADIDGIPGVAYVCIWNWGIRFPQQEYDGEGRPGAGDDVKVDYKPEIPDRIAVVFDDDSIREMQRRQGGSGHHEMTISVSDFRVEKDDPVISLGNLILRRKAWPITHGSFTIRTQNYGEWQPGQTLTLISNKRDIFDVRHWVRSDYTEKEPVRVWVINVERVFEVHRDGIWERNNIAFTSQPWEVPG